MNTKFEMTPYKVFEMLQRHYDTISATITDLFYCATEEPGVSKFWYFGYRKKKVMKLTDSTEKDDYFDIITGELRVSWKKAVTNTPEVLYDNIIKIVSSMSRNQITSLFNELDAFSETFWSENIVFKDATIKDKCSDMLFFLFMNSLGSSKEIIIETIKKRNGHMDFIEVQFKNPKTIPSESTTEYFPLIITVGESQDSYQFSPQDITANETIPLIKFITNNPFLIIKAVGGSGKTILCNFLEKIRSITDHFDYTLNIPLRNITSSMLSKVNENMDTNKTDAFNANKSIIANAIAKKYFFDNQENAKNVFDILQNHNTSKPSFIVLDGLNEVHNTDILNQILKEIYQIRKTYNNLYLWITSRETATPEYLSDFLTASISEVPEELHIKLIKNIESKQKKTCSETINRIVKTPFYYSILKTLLNEEKDIPETEYDLLDLFYRNYAKEHIGLDNLTEHRKFVYYAFFPTLAYRMLLPKTTYSIDESEIDNTIDYILNHGRLVSLLYKYYGTTNSNTITKAETQKIKELIANENWIVCENDSYSFRHQNWADFSGASLALAIVFAYKTNHFHGASFVTYDIDFTLNLPSSAIHYISEALGINVDSNKSELTLKNLKVIFDNLKPLSSANDNNLFTTLIFATLLDSFLDYMPDTIYFNERTTAFIEEISDKVLNPLIATYDFSPERINSILSDVSNRFDDKNRADAYIRMKLCYIILRKIQARTQYSVDDENLETIKNYTDFANEICEKSFISNMNARALFKRTEDIVLRKAFTADEKEAFEKGFGIVSALAEKLVTSSCNLKAHMHCFPQPYLIQNKLITKLDFLSGFGAYARGIVGEKDSVYRITPGDTIIYPLRQMLSLLLNGYIEVISPIPDTLSIIYDKAFNPSSKQNKSAFRVAKQKNSIYDKYEITEHTLNLVENILSLTEGYYRPLLSYYSACFDLKKGNKEQAKYKLIYEIERLKEIDVPLSLLPKILYNHITDQIKYDLKGDYETLLKEVCDSSKQVFYKTNYIYDYIDIKKLELSINPNRISFFKEYEAKMDVETRSRLKSVEDALFAGLRAK